MQREYFYKDNRDYLLHQQAEIVEFEIKKVRRQLDIAMRKMHHLKQDIFYYVGMINADLLIIYLLGMVVDFGNVMEKLIVVVPYLLAQFALLIFGPAIAHNISQTCMMIALNYYSEKYTEVIRKYKVVTFLAEQRNCQKVLTRYQGYMDKLDDWMLALQNDALTLTEWELEEEFGKMDLNTNIPTASQLYGPMKQMTKRLTWGLYAVVVLIAAGLILLAKKG